MSTHEAVINSRVRVSVRVEDLRDALLECSQLARATRSICLRRAELVLEEIGKFSNRHTYMHVRWR